MIIETKITTTFLVHFVEFLFFWAAIEFEIGMWSCVFAAFQTCLMCLLSVR